MSFVIFFGVPRANTCSTSRCFLSDSVSMFLLRSFEERLLRVLGGAFAKD